MADVNCQEEVRGLYRGSRARKRACLEHCSAKLFLSEVSRALCCSDSDITATLYQEYGVPLFYLDWSELLEDGEHGRR